MAVFEQGYTSPMAAVAELDLLREGALAGIPMPVTLRPVVPISDEDLMLFSRRNCSYRIERNAEGELVIMTPVGGKGSRWESYVIRELDFWAEEHGGVSFSSNGGFSLPDGSVLSPDAAWVAQSRWDALTEKQQESYPPLSPDFIVEILSASDSRQDLEKKMQKWMDNGTKLAWMIDPRAGKIIVHRPNLEPEALTRPDSVEADGPVAGFRLSLLRLWAT